MTALPAVFSAVLIVGAVALGHPWFAASFSVGFALSEVVFAFVRRKDGAA